MGTRTPPGVGDAETAGHLNPARLHLFMAASPGYRRLVLGTFGLDDAFRQLTLERQSARTSDIEALELPLTPPEVRIPPCNRSIPVTGCEDWVWGGLSDPSEWWVVNFL
jgi:hypothetical protein